MAEQTFCFSLPEALPILHESPAPPHLSSSLLSAKGAHYGSPKNKCQALFTRIADFSEYPHEFSGNFFQPLIGARSSLLRMLLNITKTPQIPRLLTFRCFRSHPVSAFRPLFPYITFLRKAPTVVASSQSDSPLVTLGRGLKKDFCHFFCHRSVKPPTLRFPLFFS